MSWSTSQPTCPPGTYIHTTSNILITSPPLLMMMKSTEVQTLGELRIGGTANGRTRSLPLVAHGESVTG